MPLVGFYCSMGCYGLQERLFVELSEKWVSVAGWDLTSGRISSDEMINGGRNGTRR